MALDVDALLDRRRQARRIAFWRALTFLLVISGIVTAVATTAGPISGQRVARIEVGGAITSDRPLLQLIARLKEDARVAAVLVAIDSPGGTSVGGERLFDALRDLSGTKPVVSSIDTLGASAAYMTALGTDRIFAQRTSLVGSIGVLIQYGNISQLLTGWGVEVAKVESGPLKAEPNPFEPTEPAAVAALQLVVDDSFAYFLELVATRRNLPEADARRLADGRIYTGAQALSAQLVDELGGEDDAVRWLQAERSVARDLPVVTYTPDDDDEGVVGVIGGQLLRNALARIGIPFPGPRPDGVDGLWSLWQAAP